MQGRPICHTLPVMRDKLVSDPAMCSNFDIKVRRTPQATATVPACRCATEGAGNGGEISLDFLW